MGFSACVPQLSGDVCINTPFVLSITQHEHTHLSMLMQVRSITLLPHLACTIEMSNHDNKSLTLRAALYCFTG